MLLLICDKARDTNIVGTMLRNGLVAEGGGDRRSALSSTGGYPLYPTSTYLSLEILEIYQSF